MALKLSDLKNKTKTSIVELSEGETFSITYKLDWYTPSMEIFQQDLKDLPLQSLVNSLEACLISWDITDDKENVIPVSKDILNELGIRILEKIITKIVDESLPNAKTPNS